MSDRQTPATSGAQADQHGLDALSMRKLAQSLGVEAMSLYNHVANKDDLFDGMVDIVISEIAVPNLGNDDWKQAMRDRANSAHSVLLQHPWVAMAIFSRVNEYQNAAENGLSLIPVDKYPYLNQLPHHILDERYDGVHDFEFGLNVILDGLDHCRDPKA